MWRPYISIPLALACLILVFLLILRYYFVVSEGYPTWEAVRNYLIRDGEIVVLFPEGVKPLSAYCDDTYAVVSINGQSVTTKVGYSWCDMTVLAETNGTKVKYIFSPKKLNNWNRIRFEPENPADPRANFVKYENGVRFKHRDLVLQQFDGDIDPPTTAPLERK